MREADHETKRTPNVNEAEDQSQAPGQGSGMTEASPNPHDEHNVVELPVRTDQSDETDGQNVAQTPSTREGRLHPSVAEGVAGGVADNDSMFNEADPQANEIGPSGTRSKADKQRYTDREKNRRTA